jgi:hypothetical protein
MPGSDITLDLKTPDQTLISLSFSDHTPTAVNEWVDNLPLANVGEVSRQLYQAIIELNKLALSANIRTQILELLRPPIDYICQELSKHYLNQSVVLSEKQQKIANLTQAIQIHLATGYKIVLLETVEQISNEKIKKNFACAAHRMMQEYGQVLLRSYQLYSSTPKNIWFEMHKVYQFSEANDLLKYTITDKQTKQQTETRIDQIYKRILLLSCCRANQLRQNEIQVAYDAFEQWSHLVNLGADLVDNSVFIINMDQDLAPRYKSLLKSTSPSHYGFDTTEIVTRLSHYLTKPKNTDSTNELPFPRQMTDVVLNHLNHSFGVLTKRSFKRIADEGSLSLCVGLSASHYFNAGKVEFHTQMLHQANSIDSNNNIFLTQAVQNQDVWSDNYDTGSHSATTPSDTLISFNDAPEVDADNSYPKYKVPLVNTSPGGYCLQWTGNVPSNIQAGEILSLRESDKQHWSIAVVRWIRHIKQQGTQIGIELLAPNAQPCGVQLLQKTGDPSEFLRGLLLPELSAIGQPATLITPRLPFQSGHKVSIRLSGAEGKCQLENRVSATGSFSQFELSESEHLKLSPDTKHNDDSNSLDSDDDFDSLWPTL